LKNSDMRDEPDIGREIRTMREEPMLAIERKLVAWSIGLGIALLGALIWLSHTFFPTG
jgi:hypothetical protein